MAFFLYDDASGRSTPTIPLFSVESCQIRQGSLSLSSLPSPQRSEAAASRREARLTQQRARLAAHHARVDQVRRAALSSPPKLVRSSDPNYGLFDSPPPGPAQAGSEPPPLDLRVSLALSRAEEHKARRVLKARRGLAKVDAVRERRRWGAAAIQGFARRNFLPPPVPPALVEAFAQPDFTISALTDSSLLSLAASASARLGTEGGGRKLLTLLLVHLRPGLALDDSDAATATASRAAMGRYAAAFHEALTPFKPHLLMAAWTLFLASFEAWRKEDRESLLADLDKSARGAWTVYLTSGLRLACLEGRPDASALALKCKHQKVGSRRHLQRIRTAYDKILGGVEEGRARMKAIKAEVEGSLDEAAVHAETLREAGPTPKPAAASGPSSPPRPAVADVKSAMSNPRLVHRILLTPASELSELTVDGGPAFAPAPSFAEYDPDAVDEGAGVEERIRAQMRKAYFDNVGAALSKSEAAAAFEEVLSTLVEKVCGLAPNRPDLRSQATKEGTPVERLLAVATVLCMLESPARAPTTQELVSFLGAGDVSPADVVKSLRYLLAKAELASLEVANWRLQLTAPLIRAKGRSYEFSRFVESFGPPPCAEAAALHEWTSAFPSPDRASFQENCVRNLLFARDAARAMPEIFLLDIEHFQRVRRLAQVSSTLCALGVHAGATARANRDALIMGLTALPVQSDVVQACVPDMSEGLVNSVMGGTDAVAKLMAQRVEAFFLSVVSHEATQTVAMKTGRIASQTTDERDVRDEIYEYAKMEAQRRGLGLVAVEVAGEATKLKAIVDHAWSVFSSLIVEPERSGE